MATARVQLLTVRVDVCGGAPHPDLLRRAGHQHHPSLRLEVAQRRAVSSRLDSPLPLSYTHGPSAWLS